MRGHDRFAPGALNPYDSGTPSYREVSPMPFAALVLTAVMVAGSAPRTLPGPDGNELLRNCSVAVRQSDGADLNPEEMVRSVWCSGYVGGFLDGLAVMSWKGGATKVCLPTDGITNGQAARIVVKYLRANPETLHQSGRISLLVSIAEAFKCK